MRVKIRMLVFGLVKSCGLVDGYQRFVGNRCFHLQNSIYNNVIKLRQIEDIFQCDSSVIFRRVECVRFTRC
jgi:hypothetical protein